VEPPLEVLVAVDELAVFVDVVGIVEELEVVVFGGSVKAAKSLLCHQTGIPSPQTVYALLVTVVVAGVPSTRTLSDTLLGT
jgi:hypothetical protein